MVCETVCTVAYLTNWWGKGSHEPLYDPHMSCLAFVRSIKGQGMLRKTRTLAGRKMQRDPTNALLVFAVWASNVLRDSDFFDAPIWLVPVPGSKLGRRVQPDDHSLILKSGSRAHLLAQKAAELMPGKARVADVLRFARPHNSAKQGNSQARDPDWLQGQLKLISPPPTDGYVILIDDVYTTGAHIQACYGVLSAAKSIPEAALCAARTVRNYVSVPYPYESYILQDF